MVNKQLRCVCGGIVIGIGGLFGQAKADTLSHWTFDTLANGGTVVEDEVGSVDGAVVGNVQLVPSGAGIGAADYGNAVSFGTSGDLLDLGEPSSFDLGKGAFTVAGWARPNADNSASSWRFILEAGTHNIGGFNVYVGPSHRSYRGKIAIDVKGNGADNIGVMSDDRIDDGEWHWFAAVSDGATVSLYVDGVKQGGSASYGAATTASTPSGVSANIGHNFDGEIDHLALFDNALDGTLDGSNTLTGGALYDLWQAQVPEPSTLGLLGAGALIFVRKRRARA
jgi:hypothetical protein